MYTRIPTRAAPTLRHSSAWSMCTHAAPQLHKKAGATTRGSVSEHREPEDARVAVTCTRSPVLLLPPASASVALASKRQHEPSKKVRRLRASSVSRW